MSTTTAQKMGQTDSVESTSNNDTVGVANPSDSTEFASPTKSKPHRTRVYTKTGDRGTSALYNMRRASKSSDTFHCLGEVDELNAFIGNAKEYCVHISTLADQLETIQARLLDIGSHIATPLTESTQQQLDRTKFDDANVILLEHWIDVMDDQLPALRNFILPSGGKSSSHLHIARAVCRRAERSTIPLLERNDIDNVVCRYLNRLSDYLFVAGRYAAQLDGCDEVTWSKPSFKQIQQSGTNTSTLKHSKK